MIGTRAAQQRGPWEDFAPGQVVVQQDDGFRPTISNPARLGPGEAERLDIARSGERRADMAENRAQSRFEQQMSREDARDQRTASTTAFDRASQLRDDFEKSPAAKSYQQSLAPYIAALQTTPDPAGDQNLVYAFAKIMDPGSVVREGEQASIASGDSWANQTTAALMKQLAGGGSFTPEYRADLRRQMHDRIGALNRAFIDERVRYKGIADRAGINPMDVVGEHPGGAFQGIEERFLGRDVPELNYQGQLPTPAPQLSGEFDIGFSGKQAADFTPEQEQAFATFLSRNPNPSAEQLNGFAQSLGLPGVANAAELSAYYAKGGRGFGGLEMAENAAEKRAAEALAAAGGDPGIRDVIQQGASFGLADEASGVANAGIGLLKGDTDIGKNYRVGRDSVDIRAEQARDRLGWVGTAAEIGGGLIGLNPAAASGALANSGLLARMAAGAKGGAAGGGAAGFGYGRGAEESVVNTAIGAGLGATVGGGLPLGGAIAKAPMEGARRLLGRQPDLSRQLVGDAVTADGNTPMQIAQRLEDAGGRGSPLTIADTGDNARGLLSSVARQPGPSRTIARERVGTRQMEQGDRISAAATRDLGQAPNIRDTSDQLIERARTAAAPHYEEAYAAPAVGTPEIEALLATPAGRAALARARTIAANERRDPTSLGFALDDNGDVVLNPVAHAEYGAQAQARSELTEAQEAYRAARGAGGDLNAARERLLTAREAMRTADDALAASPAAGTAETSRQYSPQTLDYVKRGLDDVLEQHRDPVTQRLHLDEAGRSVNDVRASFVSELDRVNPAYGRARQEYQGPARLKTALDLGSKALNQSADEVAAAVSALRGAEEREMFASGYRKAIEEHLEGRTDGADKVGALIGTTKKRRALVRVFGGRTNFDRFIATLGDERSMNDTYRAVSGGSQTAERLADDAVSSDQGIIDSAVDTALSGSTLTGMVVKGMQKLRSVNRFGAGEAGKRVRGEVAEMLTEADPKVLQELSRALRRAQADRRLSDREVGKRSARTGVQVGRVVGAGIGSKAASRNRRDEGERR